MKKLTVVLAVAAGSCLLFVIARENGSAHKLSLPTGKRLTLPVPGFIARTNSFPATIALSPDGRYAALLNQGYGTQQSEVRQSIAILDLGNNRLRDFPDDRLRGDERSTLLSYFIGLAFSSDGKHLYASMGSARENGIAVYKFANGDVTPERFITIPAQPVASGKILTLETRNVPGGTAPAYPAGLAVLNSPEGDRLIVASNLSDNVILVDVASGRILKSFDVSTGKYIPAAYPYTVIVNRAGTRGWVSLWNGSAVAELDLQQGTVTRRIELWRPSDPVAPPRRGSAPPRRGSAPGSHPTAMLLNRSEDTLYVAMSNAATSMGDGVAAVNLKRGVAERCYSTVLGGKAEPGTSPIAIALSGDEKHLYAAVASLNAVAAFDIKSGDQAGAPDVQSPAGFIPTEWYPSALAFAGNDLLIASAKGDSSGPNNMKASVQTGLHPNPHPYIATLIGGAVQRLGLGEINTNLAAYTRQVEDNNLVHQQPGKIEFAGGRNPIRHVIYILKENRTYDQILGDLGVGEGDPSLTMYGAGITPNEHKLALQFGVLDNFYDSGDVSANGHLWSDASATSDYIEKIWPIIYRGSRRPPELGNALDRELPVLDDPGTGFLWDNLARHNFTYRIYGEMLDLTWCRDEKRNSPREGAPSAASGAENRRGAACPSAEIKPGEALPASLGNPRGGPSPWPWPVPLPKSIRPTKEAQRGHIDPLYPDFEIDYPDQLRCDEFLREFDEFVRARGTAQELPQFIQVFLPNDHTGGTRPDKPSPRASVADNDLAVGRLVDAVSHSPYWDDTAIFVVEDDAQDGADHVDAHRSIALVISKYSPRSDAAFVDHHFYTTVSMIHTMEDLLGLPAMNLFDSHAPLMGPLFAGPGTQPPYGADDRNLRGGLLYEMNGKNAPGSKKSARMDFSRPDAVNARELNAILWRDAKAREARPVRN
ncbi:MAG TPA: phosphoesterase [Blastocatellia bacterium]|nr:phosphoesterase [Blastocatellia bacterium]